MNAVLNTVDSQVDADPKPSTISRPHRYFVAALTAAMGMAISLLGYFAISDSEERLSTLKLKELAGSYQQLLNSDLDRAIEVLYTLRAYYDTSEQVNRREFESFSRGLSKRLPGLRGSVWAKRVNREERFAFEQSIRAQGFTGFEIWERGDDGERRRAGDREVFFPILYSDPADITTLVIGFDVSSNPERADAMVRSRLSGLPAATLPTNVIYLPEKNRFLTFLPVYPKVSSLAEGAPEPIGYVYAAFSTNLTVDNILQHNSAATSGLDLYLFNPTTFGEDRSILWHPARSRGEPVTFPGEAALRAGRHWEGEIKVADRNWGAIFTPSSEFAASNISWQAPAVLALGLALTAAIVVYLLLSLQRTLRLEFLTVSLRKTGNQLQRESALVTQLASIDSMTGLANRATFQNRLATAFKRAKQEDGNFAVLCIDLDHFKDVNDTLGHPVGDRLLQIAATRLTQVVSHDDVIARPGGDEFALLIFNVSDHTVISGIASRIVTTLNQCYELDGNLVRVTASIGIAVFSPSAATSPEDLLIYADQALYQAKSEGRNGYYFHCAALDREVRERVTVNEELQAALRNSEFVLHYQPQVEFPSGRIDGLEALIRWHHPTRGLLFPGAFLPTAETTGMMAPMGRFVLEEACRQIKRWQAEGLSPPPVAVNISAAQLKGVVPLDEELREILTRHDLDPSRIEIELTEFALVEATKANRDQIKRVRELGVSVAIDDFGTGYSSLEYLRAYRVNRLKIPQQFITQVAIEAGDAAIVRAALVLARELGMAAIAEGIETPAQLAFLLAAGCHHFQGYYFSKPLPVDELHPLLSEGVIEREATPRAEAPPKLMVG
jgi:diguanylate cyclase (GGDEF)-like protein